MLSRRSLLMSSLALCSTEVAVAKKLHSGKASYRAFIGRIEAQALAKGIRQSVIDDAFASLKTPNSDVIARDRHQPEYAMTWTDYRDRIITEARLTEANQSYLAQKELINGISRRYQVDPGVIVAIWGLESSFGTTTGRFNIFDALTSLAFEGRRRAFFSSELFNALKIAEQSGISPSRMKSSYAGAMGQPQFMPSAYLNYAADGDGDGVADIWNSRADVFASIANYLHHSGWEYGQPWGRAVDITKPLPIRAFGKNHRASNFDWSNLGVVATDGSPLPQDSMTASLIQPGGEGASGVGQAFLVYNNFRAIRRYNPSDFYALGVGLISDAATKP